MTIRFVDAGSGNDANAGRDNIGIGLTTATWTEATFTLTQVGHGYTFSTGDVIWIGSGTGVTPGLYEVASSTADDIVLVETSTLPTVDNASDFAAGDLSTGDIASDATGPKLTIQATLAAVAAGDHVWIRSGTDYNEELTIVTAGTATSPIIVEGYTTTLGDEGVPVNDGTAGALVSGLTPIAGSNYYVWKNFYNKDFSAGFGKSNADFMSLYRVECKGSAGGGIIADDNCVLVGCHSHDNTGKGFNIGSVGVLYACVAANNGAEGIHATSGIFVANCLCYGNTGNGINWVGAAVYGLIADNTVVAASASGNTGIHLNASNTANRYLCCNNTVSGYSGAGGIGIQTSAIGQRAFFFNNNIFDCETPYSGGAGDLGGGTTADPDFVDAASDDYTPDTASPLIAAGFDILDVPNVPSQTTQTATVGALLRAAVSGGGGLLVHPGTSGGARA